MNESKKEREIVFDVAKGIGVFLVIIGQMPRLMPVYVKAWVDSFHMPLFFFIAGYFAKEVLVGQSVFLRIWRNTKKILIPYLLYSVIFGGLYYSKRVEKEYLWALLKSTITGYGGYYVLWFLFSLFLMGTIFLLLTRYIRNAYVCGSVCGLLVVLGFCMNYFQWGNPLTLGTTFYGFGFYGLGFLFKKKGLKNVLLQKRCFIICLIYGLIGTTFLLKVNGNTLEMITNSSFDIIVNYTVALAGIMNVLYISKNIKIRLFEFVLSYIGKNSLYFYPITAFVPDYCKLILGDKTLVKIIGRIIAFPITVLVIQIKQLLNKGNKYKWQRLFGIKECFDKE